MPDDVQQQIAEIQHKLTSLADMRDAIGEEAYQKGKANLEAQIQVLTAGGAFVGGSLTVGSGKFVGRDGVLTTSQQNKTPQRHYPSRLCRRIRNLRREVIWMQNSQIISASEADTPSAPSVP